MFSMKGQAPFQLYIPDSQVVVIVLSAAGSTGGSGILSVVLSAVLSLSAWLTA